MVDPQEPTAELLIAAYARGIFPMADPRTREIEWFSPDPRGIFDLERFHVPARLARTVRARRFEIRTDTDFEGVMRRCAATRPGRSQTWIDERLIRAYVELHLRGAAHSVEAWRNGELVGGLYGVHLGGAFFGESMFSRPELGGTDASKVCLVQLVELMRAHGFTLLDTQLSNRHLAQFNCVEIPRRRYLQLLQRALRSPARWPTDTVLSRASVSSAIRAEVSRSTRLLGLVEAVAGEIVLRGDTGGVVIGHDARTLISTFALERRLLGLASFSLALENRHSALLPHGSLPGPWVPMSTVQTPEVSARQRRSDAPTRHRPANRRPRRVEVARAR
jgi:leucyl/phenylalanyl-tRNA---protein transferase